MSAWPLTAEEIAAVERRLARTPNGPWRKRREGSSWIVDACGETVAVLDDRHHGLPQNGDNAVFVEHSREDVRRLLATIRARDDEIAKLRAESDAAKASAHALHNLAFHRT